MPQKNMYQDAIYTWNIFKGCLFQCKYCIPSFQRQAKRQKPVIDKNGNKRGCQACYEYKPHFHPERLKISLPRTTGDQFIWACSSGDVSFMAEKYWVLVLDRIESLPERTFFMQSKDPSCFQNRDLPENLIIGTTIESNRDYGLSKAPMKWMRKQGIENIDHPRKNITIEPLMKFDLDIMVQWIQDIMPERVYIGYDTKNCGLPEPCLPEVLKLIEAIKPITKVKPKLLREGNGVTTDN
jgi:hypothetical protein